MSKGKSLSKSSIPKVLLSALLAGAVSMGVAGCGTQAVDTSEEPVSEVAESGTQEEPSPAGDSISTSVEQTIQQDDRYELTGHAQSFSEGYAWVAYKSTSDDATTQIGCIDKKGRIILSMNGSETMMTLPTAFENGYSYVPDGEHVVYSIATDGTVVKYGDEDDWNTRILAYGGGYVIVGKYEANFDAEEYVFEIQDSKGEVIETFSLKGDEIDDESTGLYTLPEYCGQGVFGLQIDTNGGNSTDFYCCKTDTWVKEAASDSVRFLGDSDTAFAGVAYPDSDAGELELVFMTSSGEVKRHLLPPDIKGVIDACVSDGKCVIHNFDRQFYVYDLASETLKQMPDEYAKTLDTDYYTGNMPFFNDGLCVMIAVGADGERYFEAFDADWNRQFDPIKVFSGWNYIYYAGGLLTAEPMIEADGIGFTDNDTAVFDKSGNQLWIADGYLSPQCDGLFMHAEDAGFGARTQQMGEDDLRRYYTSGKLIDYLDDTGKPAFESLDATGAKTITLV